MSQNDIGEDKTYSPRAIERTTGEMLEDIRQVLEGYEDRDPLDYYAALEYMKEKIVELEHEICAENGLVRQKIIAARIKDGSFFGDVVAEGI